MIKEVREALEGIVRFDMNCKLEYLHGGDKEHQKVVLQAQQALAALDKLESEEMVERVKEALEYYADTTPLCDAIEIKNGDALIEMEYHKKAKEALTTLEAYIKRLESETTTKDLQKE